METGLTAAKRARRAEFEAESSKTGSSGMASGNSIEVQTTLTHSDITEMEDGIKSLQQTSLVQQQLCQPCSYNSYEKRGEAFAAGDPKIEK